MIVQPIDYFLLAWFVAALISTAYVAWDQFRNNPEPTVMRIAFILVTLYMGPFGLLIYVLADKEPRPGTHEQFTASQWKQGIGSTIHCVAGDATGIILAAVITAAVGLPMWLDLIVEYTAGFAFGLLIFQALFMRRIMGGTYWDNVRHTFLPEFMSMNAMMAGMAPVMSFLMMGRDMRAMVPTELLFWGVMAVGVGVGFVVAYPVNLWMVNHGLKHGLMTERRAGSRFALGRDVAKAGGHGQGHGHEQHGSDSQTRQPAKRGKPDGHSDMACDVTTPQLVAVASVTTLMLLAGLIVPGLFVNLSLSAHDVGGSIMPRGMVMDFDTPAAAMRDMSAVHPKHVSYRAAQDARGDQGLEPRIENGTKVFRLEASVVRWNILEDVYVDAYAFNQQVPGPRLRLVEGDHVRIHFRNSLPESTTIHWHGLVVPNEMDGPAHITQEPVPPGGTYVYEYTVLQAGTFFYHTHDHADRQQALGLYGALVIEPREETGPRADLEYVIQLQEWLKREWLTYPAMLMDGGLPNYFSINGKAYPSTDVVRMRVGQTVKFRFIGTNNNFVHPMHIHGGPFEVVALDGTTLSPSARYLADTINVGPGQRWDVIWKARRPGKWLLHCHIPHHTTNNNVEIKGAGGLTMILDVE